MTGDAAGRYLCSAEYLHKCAYMRTLPKSFVLQDRPWVHAPFGVNDLQLPRRSHSERHPEEENDENDECDALPRRGRGWVETLVAPEAVFELDGGIGLRGSGKWCQAGLGFGGHGVSRKELSVWHE